MILITGSILASIPSSHYMGINYFHSFGISQNYIIVRLLYFRITFHLVASYYFVIIILIKIVFGTFFSV